MLTHWRLAKNAASNLARGAAAGVVAIFLPAALVRHMSQIDYSVWVLVLQVAAYAGYLEFGLQTAVGRYIAVAHEKNDDELRDSVFSTASIALWIAASIGLILLVGAACTAGWLFPETPAVVLPQLRWALLIVGASIALGLPATALSAVFVGLQRNEFIALVTGGSKLVSAGCLVVAAIWQASLVQMAIVVATVNLAAYVTLYILVKRLSAVRFRRQLVSKSAARELSSYCFSLMVWNFSMMLVNGLDLILVGRFELKALAPYALATTLVTFIAGIQNAIFSATMPHAAVLHARNDSVALGNLVIASTRLGVLLLLFTGMPLLIYSAPILRIWVGEQYAVQGSLLLTVLLVANMIRLTGTPYATVLVASGQQRLVILSPLMEGFSNLIASVLLGLKFGAAGVAAGTMLGAVVGMLGNVFYSMHRTPDIRFSVRAYIRTSIVRPCLCAVPVLSAALLRHFHLAMEPFSLAAMAASACICSVGLFWTIGLASLERLRIRTMFMAIARRLEMLCSPPFRRHS